MQIFYLFFNICGLIQQNRLVRSIPKQLCFVDLKHQYGSFKPCKEIVDAYRRYVEKYKAKRDITTVEKLSKHIEDCIAGEYEPLACCDEASQNRIDYMNGNIGLLTMTVIQKNPEAFGDLQMSSHVEC